MAWRTPPAEGELSDDGERYRLTWWPTASTTMKALFRVATDDGVAVLQHVRTIRVQQRGETGGEIDADATLEDIPAGLVAAMRADALRPADSRHAASSPDAWAGDVERRGDA
jgi:hypothetical protein